MLRQATTFLQRPYHCVERVGDADDERVGSVFFDSRTDLPHDFEVDIKQIVAAHAGLARHARGDDAYIGTFDPIIAIGPDKPGIEIIDGRGFCDIEGLALRDALHDVEEHDVPKLFQSNEVSQRAANLAGADQRNLVTRHDGKTLDLRSRGPRQWWWLSG